MHAPRTHACLGVSSLYRRVTSDNWCNTRAFRSHYLTGGGSRPTHGREIEGRPRGLPSPSLFLEPNDALHRALTLRLARHGLTNTRLDGQLNVLEADASEHRVQARQVLQFDHREVVVALGLSAR